MRDIIVTLEQLEISKLPGQTSQSILPKVIRTVVLGLVGNVLK